MQNGAQWHNGGLHFIVTDVTILDETLGVPMNSQDVLTLFQQTESWSQSLGFDNGTEGTPPMEIFENHSYSSGASGNWASTA